MEFTIVTRDDGTREMYLGVQELTWAKASVYDVGQTQLDDLALATQQQVQYVLYHITKVCPLIKELPNK